MLRAVAHSLAHVADFSGRDGRATFWWYMLAVQLVTGTLGLVAAFSAAPHGEAAILDMALKVGLLTGVATVMLVAASLVRRLHDSGLPGWIALVPGALYGVLLVQMPGVAEQMKQVGDAAVADRSLTDALLEWLPWILVIVIGVLPSTPGANRYGSDPQ